MNDTNRPPSYPRAERGDLVDDYHGTLVPDPYRWLEDLYSERTRAWIAAQNELAFGFVRSVPEREAIRARLAELWNYERCDVPRARGGRYFFMRNDGLCNQSALYVADSLEEMRGDARLLLDPNDLSPDGTVALTIFEPSDDGALLIYGLSSAGSDWQEWRVRDAATGEDRPDLLSFIKFSEAAWTADGAGFFYSRYDEPDPQTRMQDANYYQKLFYHRLGTPQSEDELVYERPDAKEWGFSAKVTEDGRYLLVTVWRGSGHQCQIFYTDLRAGGAMVELLTGFDAEYVPVGSDGHVVYFRTDKGAPRGRVVAVDLLDPSPERWREVVAEREETLERVSLVGERFVCNYLKDARSHVLVFGLEGGLEGEIELPGVGTAWGFTGRRRDRETFYGFTNATTPNTIFRYDLDAGASEVLRAPRLAFDPGAFETRQVFYESKDGTRVPMFVSHRKGLALDGANPTYLYGYGGFNVALTPTFSPGILAWMELGGVCAMPNLRGGGEYGEAWHEAGRRLKKQNVFDDFFAAAEWLMAERYTSTPRLAIGGGSNGGLLVGACLTQRPELFGAAVPAVGVFDMLRFHKFTIGWGWVSDYGCADDPEEFRALYAYSPLHAIREGTCYPPTLITTGDHDDRVVPAHSYKFAAALQAAQGCDAPILIRVDTDAGHGAGKPTAKAIEEVADRWTFLVRALGMTVRRD